MKWIALLAVLPGLFACSHLQPEMTENPQVVAAPMYDSRVALSDEVPWDVTNG